MRRYIIRGIGLLAAAMLAVLIMYSMHKEQRSEAKAGESEKESGAVLSFQSEEFYYSGEGDLDLMEGVTAADADGTDLTSKVNALLTGKGSTGRKKIRYTVFSSGGKETTGERTLVLEHYEGPRIEVQDTLELAAEDLEDLIAVLKDCGEIKGTDGFGVDITGRITWHREKISRGLYQIVFSLCNDYLDETQRQVQAHISGEVQDLTLTLLESRIEILAGSEFSPWDYLESADDPSFGNIADRVQIQNMVNTQIPGSYPVVYSVTSVDGTQTAEAVLNVTVTGG